MAGSRCPEVTTTFNLLWFLLHLILAQHVATVHAVYGSVSVQNNSRALLYNKQRNIHANISELLDNLLRGYDNSVRPDFGGKFWPRINRSHFSPTNIIIIELIAAFRLHCGFIGPPAVVEVDIMVRSMGPISEVDMVIINWLRD